MAKLLLAMSLVLSFWSVSSGQTEPNGGCPEFMIVGPSGVWMPEETVSFQASVSGSLPDSAKFVWTVNGGTILAGQGTLAITMLIDKAAGDTIVARLKIEGLPSNCTSETTDSVTICRPSPPILIDEFSTPNGEIDAARLTSAAKERQNNPTNQLYIIEYFPPGTADSEKEEKVAKIKDQLAKVSGFELAAVTIATADADTYLTKIYRVPPGSDNPFP